MKDNNNTDLKIAMVKGKHYNGKEYARYFTVNNVKCPIAVVISTEGGDKIDTIQQQIKSANQTLIDFLAQDNITKNNTMTPIQKNYFANLTLQSTTKVYGYVRGSNGAIDKDNQIDAINKIANARSLDIEYIEDTVSSGKTYEQRKISKLIKKCIKGDTIIVAELSRFARNTEEMLMISRVCLEDGINLEILNPSLKFDDSIATKALITVMGLANEMERHFIKSRTKMSLARRKEEIAEKGFFINKQGEKVYALGAKKGRYQALKLEPQAKQVLHYKSLGLNHTAIGKLFKCSRITVDRFLKRYPIKKGVYIKNPPSIEAEIKKKNN